MEDLRVERRTFRVGGDVTWGEWSWSPDSMVRWAEANLLLLLTILTVVVVTIAVWRFVRGGAPPR
jgi:hypothetical protein